MFMKFLAWLKHCILNPYYIPKGKDGEVDELEVAWWRSIK